MSCINCFHIIIKFNIERDNMLYIFANILLIWFGLNNISQNNGKLIIAGEISNTIAIVSNNFKMPAINYTNTDDTMHTYLNNKTNFPFLCDDFSIFDFSFSIGDILIVYGIVSSFY
ncbi:MAG: DUF5317 family protein [Candidatus Micrarchaeaceae archaeon]